MPGQLKDKLPNLPLNGQELQQITRMEMNALLAKDPAFSPQIAYRQAALSLELNYVLPFPHQEHTIKSRTQRMEVPSLTGALIRDIAEAECLLTMDRDYIFKGSHAFRFATITITATFHLGDPYEPRPGDKISCRIEGEAPLKSPPERTVVIALKREVKLENPNIDRINHDMPIVVQRATPPQAMIPENPLPNEPPTAVIGAPGVENLEFRYDKTQFPAPTAPVDSDISQQAAARLGVPQQTGA